MADDYLVGNLGPTVSGGIGAIRNPMQNNHSTGYSLVLKDDDYTARNTDMVAPQDAEAARSSNPEDMTMDEAAQANEVNASSEPSSKIDPAILAQFKYRLTPQKKKQLKAKYPIISGYILEHFLRYGKPPFKNFPILRDIKTCRYGD